MKVRKVYLVMLALVLFLSGCGNNNDSKEIPQRYIEAIELVKSDLKDPTSMRIYGDIIVLTLVESNNTVISIVYDAKNSYGAYSGKSTAEIMLSPELDPFYVKDDSDYFMDVRSMADRLEDIATKLENGNLGESERERYESAVSQAKIEILSGETVASLLDAEYYSA